MTILSLFGTLLRKLTPAEVDANFTSLRTTADGNAASIATMAGKLVSGLTASAATGVATTLFALPGPGMYLIYTGLQSSGSQAYGAFATVVKDATNARIVANNATNMTLTLSGNNVQATQTSGAPNPINYCYQLVA